MRRPFSLRIFVPSGDPEGLLVASRDDWTGKAIIFPRDLIGEAKGRKEFQQPGVYLLIGSKTTYIGEGDPVGARLERHAHEKAFWRRAIFFTADAGRLNKAHVQHLESQLVRLAKETGRVMLDNVNTPLPPALSEEEQAFAENFLSEILAMLPLLGFHQLSDEDEELSTASTADADSEGQVPDDSMQENASAGKRAATYSNLPRGVEFYLNYGGVFATLELAEGGVMVKEGSRLIDPPRATFELHCPAYSGLRRQLMESGVIAKVGESLQFTADQFFSSASAASSVICGMARNADHWVASNGQNLGDLLRKARSKA